MTTLQLPDVPFRQKQTLETGKKQRTSSVEKKLSAYDLPQLQRITGHNEIPLYIGDNLATMQGMESESVDCIYADPPYNTKRSWATMEKGEFDDSWYWGKDLGGKSVKQELQSADLGQHGALIKALPLWISSITGDDSTKSTAAYAAFMTPRLYHMWRLLKETGICYLHVSTRNAWALTGIMDAIFGESNRLGTLVWTNSTTKHDASKFPVTYDTILMYAKKRGHYNWTKPTTELTEQQIKRFKEEDDRGHYLWQATFSLNRKQDLTPARKARREAIMFRGMPIYKLYTGIHDMTIPLRYIFQPLIPELPEDMDKLSFSERLAIYDEHDVLRLSDNYVLYYKRYLANTRGNPVPDIIPQSVAPYIGFHRLVSDQDREAWRTQKPPLLLKLLIEAVTVEGDVVFDPFMGSGTTCAVAYTLGRNAVGADLQAYSRELIPILNQRLPEYWKKQTGEQYPDRDVPVLKVYYDPPIRKAVWNEGGATSAAKSQYLNSKNK